jgi:hypothetical protein
MDGKTAGEISFTQEAGWKKITLAFSLLKRLEVYIVGYSSACIHGYIEGLQGVCSARFAHGFCKLAACMRNLITIFIV